MAYKAPIWEDGKSPAISADNLNNLSQAAEGAQVLYGNSAPTSSTKGAVGQFYLVVLADSDGNYPLYQCVAIANGSYTWRDTRRIPDSITSMLGIPAPGTINRALNVLANVGNLHVWERVRILSEPIYKPEESSTNTSITLEPGDILYYSSGVDVVGLEESDISLSEPVSSFSYNGSNFPGVVGKYIRQDGSDLVYYYPTSDQNIAGSTLYLRGCKKISATIGTPARTTTDYLTSTDRNAYPDNETDAQDAYYTLGDPVDVTFFNGITTLSFRYGSDVTVSDDGTTVSIERPTEYGWYGANINGVTDMSGKFLQLYSAENFTLLDEAKRLYFMPSTSMMRFESGNYVRAVVQPVTGHAAIPANTTITYLGQLGGGARIEVWSYVGTGTYGSSNPNSLTFGFVPKYVRIIGSFDRDRTENVFNEGIQSWNYGVVMEKVPTEFTPRTGFGDTRTYSKKSSDGKTLYWYDADNAYDQYNGSGYRYYVLAIA